MKRFQIVSDDAVWMFPAELTLSTVEMKSFSGYDFGYKYETCLFRVDDSDVLARYQTKEDAIAGHRKFEKQYNLKETKNAKRISG